MNNRGGIIRLAVSGLCCAIIIIYSSYCFLFNENSNLKDHLISPVNSSFEDTISTDIETEQSEEENSASSALESTDDSQSSSNTDDEAVEASTTGTVKGKIIEKFSSPYTANTSYNNVYLKNSTGLSIDIKSLLSASLGYKIEKNDKPQVLIVHTHTTESFMTENRDYYTDKDASRTTDSTKNMIKLGEIVASALNAEGIKTIHDTTTHDYPEYNGSYTRAAGTIKTNLKKYPSIKIVIDMHRDAVSSNGDKSKLITEINGKKAAQIMLVMGSQSGSITNFPDWQENLKLAVKLQQTLEVMYPSLARAINFVSRNYNENLTTGSMLIEMGTDGNTLEEVSYSAELLANALISLLNTLT